MSIFSKLSQIKELPSLPEVLVKVRALINSDDAGAKELAKIIEQDPAISSTILKTANSAYYNISRRQIDSISEAITRVGFNEVQKITVAISVIKQFSGDARILDYQKFWSHSIAAASLVSYIADICEKWDSRSVREHIYMSGLLHDIGILILDQFFHNEFAIIAKRALDEGKTFLQIEETLTQKESHAFIGGALLEIWKNSQETISAVRFHHTPEKAPESMRKLVAAVSITEYLLCGGNYGFEGHVEKPAAKIWGEIGLVEDDEDKMNPLKERAVKELEKATIILNSASSKIPQLANQINRKRSSNFILRSI